MKRDDGYILASVLGVILAISLVAAALVGTSGDVAFGVKRHERAAVRDSVLQSAIVVLALQLTQDPRRRVVDLETAGSVQILGRAVSFRIAWETTKLNVNAAELPTLEAAIRDLDLEEPSETNVLANLRSARAGSKPIRLLSDIARDKAEEDCLASALTVFGNRTERLTSSERTATLIGRPAAGSILALDVAVTGEEADGLSVVLMLTGGAETPWRVMDWRASSSLKQGKCHAA